MIRVEIRELRASDLGDVLSIEHSSFDQPWGAARFRRYLRACGGLAIVASHAGYLVGYAVCRRTGPELRIQRLAVLEIVRREHVGRALITKLVAQCGNTANLVIDVSEWDDDAHLFLRATGFIATGTHRDDKGGYVYEFTHKFASLARMPVDCGNQVP